MPTYVLALLSVFFLALPACAAGLLRGPYLQMGSDTAVTIVWRTGEPTTAKVEYGTSPGALDRKVESTASATQHEIRLTGLQPSTRYWYAVGTTTERLAGGDANHFFETAPAPGTRTKFRAWVVGDSGTGNLAQAAVRDAMLRDTGRDRPDIYLHLGDMAYTDGTDQQFQMNFFDVYQLVLRNTVVWPTMGNHEGKSSKSGPQTGPYYDAYVLPKQGEAGGVASGTEAWYSFDYANVHFVVLDSHDSPRTVDGPMLTWLEQDLEATDQDWIVAFMHHPPYTKGSHDSDTEGQLIDMREKALPILEAHGVDLVLAGHSHIYERSYLLDGAYETPSLPGLHILDDGDGATLGDGPYAKRPKTAHDGTVYVVAGHGGTGLSGSADHPLMVFSEKKHGSALLDIDGDRMTLANVRSDGTRSDTFTIMKAQGLVLGTPNGGEALKSGTTHTVKWATKGEHPFVHFDVSFDGGATWTSQADAVPNTGEWTWTVPAATSTNVVLRIADAADREISDTTDATFTVYEGDAPPTQENRPPEITPLGTYEGPAGTIVSLQLSGADPDGDTLTWSADELPPGASLEGTYFFWIPTLQQAGVWTVTFTADDGRGATASTTWTARLADEDGNVPEPETPEAPQTTAPATGGCGCTATPMGLVALVGAFALRRRRVRA